MHYDALSFNQEFWSSKGELHNAKLKHCQRPNRPKGWVVLQVLTQILIKFHLQNIDQTSTSKSQAIISISTKLKLDQTEPQNLISAKIQLLDLNQTFNFKIMTKPCAQSLKNIYLYLKAFSKICRRPIQSFKWLLRHRQSSGIIHKHQVY